MSKENGTQGFGFSPKRKRNWVRIKETLSLNASRVADSVILCDIG